MNSTFLCAALSRQDGTKADGIHLLWTAPFSAGYSVNGYDIQRRLSQEPEITCHTLTRDELQRLHRDLRLEIPVGLVGVRRASCPVFPKEPPDEPFEGEDQVPQQCIDFRAFQAGSGPNPKIEQEVKFQVYDQTGSLMRYSEIGTWSRFKGFKCGYALEIELPHGTPSIELSLVHLAEPAEIEVFNVDGTPAGKATMRGPQGQVERFSFTGTAMAKVVIRAPQNETLLLKFCYKPQRAVCVDFRNYQPGGRPNPGTENAMRFEVRDHTGNLLEQREIGTWRGITGLNCGFSLEITLPFRCLAVELTLVRFARPARIEAFNADGTSAGQTKMKRRQGQKEILKFEGQAIKRIVVEAPENETLLLQVCVEMPENAGGWQANHEGQPARFLTPEIDLFTDTKIPHHAATAAIVVPGPQQGPACIAYDIDLRTRHQFVSIAAGVPGMLAIALREEKAVDVRLVSNASGVQEAIFERRSVDRVLLYVSRAASSLTVCVDSLPRPEAEEKEWKNVPFIARNIQLPVRAVNDTLASGSDEKNLALSRLLDGEGFDDSHFREVAGLLNETASQADNTSPMWYTVATRADLKDPLIELRGWPYSLSLLMDPAWRRILGFGFFDNGQELTPGEAYDYRISAAFRRRDLEEELHGFHTIPSGTTLPASFHLGPFLLHTRIPVRVDLIPPTSENTLRKSGRKGIALQPTGPDGMSLAITFPVSVRKVVVEFEPNVEHSLEYEARTSVYIIGLSGSVFTDTVPQERRVTISFPEPIDTLTLKGHGFFYGLRVVNSPEGADPDEIIKKSCIVYGVRYEPTALPPPPPFLGTLNLQKPIEPGDPAVTTQSPPQSMGFRLLWLPPPAAGSPGPVPWPPDLAAFPPIDVLGFRIERRRVDTGDPFIEIDEQSPHTLYFGNRSHRKDPPQLYPGIDLLRVFPEKVTPEPPVSVFMDIDDVLVSAAKQGPPPGSLHQYRIFSVDAIGRQSQTAAVGSIARLEKHLPPPRPIGPTTLPPPGSTLPSGVRVRVLQASDPNITPTDQELLGTSTNAVVLEWGWTGQERDRDPFAKEFRVYWQPIPPDKIHGEFTGPVLSTNGFYEMTAELNQAVAVDAMKGRYIHAGDYPFKVASHTGGQSIMIRFERAELDESALPEPASFEFHPLLNGSELRPSAWPERTAVIAITDAANYQHIFRDRLTLDADHPLACVWAGVSAADDQAYIDDEIPLTEPNGGRPGNESSIVAVPAQARYYGRPVFTVPPPLADVPEQVTDEPGTESISVSLDLNNLLPEVTIPAGHRITLERLAVNELIAILSAKPDNKIGVKLPGGTSTSYTLDPPDDHTTFLAQIRTTTPGRIEGRFLMDLLIRFLAQLDSLWEPAIPAPVTFGAVADALANKADRYIHRIRLVDAVNHVSREGAILPQLVRVPSLRIPAVPEFEVPGSDDDTLAVHARVHDAFDLKWLIAFTLVTETSSPLDERRIAKPQLLRLPNRRDLYPNDGIRLRLRDGTLLKPAAAVEVSTGTLELPDRLLTLELTIGFEKLVSVWIASVTRDGIPSRFAGPHTVSTGPQPLVVPLLSVVAQPDGDHASWGALAVPAQVALERSNDGGASWNRVTPWLPETKLERIIPAVAGERFYRMVLRGLRGNQATGEPVGVT